MIYEVGQQNISTEIAEYAQNILRNLKSCVGDLLGMPSQLFLPSLIHHQVCLWSENEQVETLLLRQLKKDVSKVWYKIKKLIREKFVYDKHLSQNIRGLMIPSPRRKSSKVGETQLRF